MLCLDPKKIKIVSVGQALIKHDLRRYEHEDFKEIIKIIKDSDISFTNLETSIASEIGGWPTKEAYYVGSESFVLDVLKWMGFNLLSLANNHSFDCGPFGILSTIKHTKERGFGFAGTGASLEAAAAPGYMETPKGRVALISMASGALPENAFAASRCIIPNLPGVSPKIRPGINPLRVETHHVVKKRDLDRLKELAKKTGLELMKVTPFFPWKQGKVFSFYREKFVEGEEYAEKRIINKEDINRNLKNIKTAQQFSDYVFVYLHQHHWEPDWQKTPKWVQEFAHDCIDAGATAFIGHGVPMLHGVEIYKDRPIFYSLGNFIFHIHHDRARDPKIWESVVSVSEYENKKIKKIRFYPIALGGEEAIVDLSLN